MRRRGKELVYAACGVLALGFPANILAQGGQQAASRAGQSLGNDGASSTVATKQINQSAAAASIEETTSAEFPDSPSMTLAQSGLGQQNSLPPSSNSAQPESSSAQESREQRPTGTAAAEAPTVSGVTAAQPAGVAIAPAKQRRVRTIVLKIGAIVGASAALGVTLALTAGTPSKPPGAH